MAQTITLTDEQVGHLMDAGYAVKRQYDPHSPERHAVLRSIVEVVAQAWGDERAALLRESYAPLFDAEGRVL